MAGALSRAAFFRILLAILKRLACGAGVLVQQYRTALFPRAAFGLYFFADLLHFIGMRFAYRMQQVPDHWIRLPLAEGLGKTDQTEE